VSSVRLRALACHEVACSVRGLTVAGSDSPFAGQQLQTVAAASIPSLATYSLLLPTFVTFAESGKLVVERSGPDCRAHQSW
jgi:hypothetical protein